MNALRNIDQLHDTARNLLVDNDDFHRQRVNGRWEAARAPAEFPVAIDFIKGPCAELLSQLDVILQQARTECSVSAGARRVSDSLLNQTDGATPAALVESEFEYLELKLKTLAHRALDQFPVAPGRTHRDIDTFTFLHDALLMEACDFCEDVERSKAFIGFMLRDPSGYLEDLNNRRWDAANLAFSEEPIEGTLCKADSWRQIGNAWTREFQVENASGDKNYGIVSVHFRRLHSVPERITARLANPKIERDTGIELEIS